MRTHFFADDERFPKIEVHFGPSAFAILAGMLLLIASWLFPPHRAVLDGVPMVDQTGAGLRYVFASQEVWSDQRTFAPHWRLLLLIDLGIILASAAATAILRAAENEEIRSNATCVWRKRAHHRLLRLQSLVVATGFSLLLLAWLFPPWTAVRGSVQLEDQRGAGFRYVFKQPRVWSDRRTFVIDWPTLLIINSGILLATAAGLVAVRSEVE